MLSIFISWGIASTVLHNSETPCLRKLFGPHWMKVCSYWELFCWCGIKQFKAYVYYKQDIDHEESKYPKVFEKHVEFEHKLKFDEFNSPSIKPVEYNGLKPIFNNDW